MRELWLTSACRPGWQRWGSWAGAGLTGLCLAIVGIIAYRERGALTQYVQAADVIHLLGALGWYTADLAIYVVAWASILNRLGNRVRLLDHVRIFCLSNAAKRLPGTLWYIGGRAVLYRRAGVPVRLVLIASGIEAALIWLSGMLIAIPFLMAIKPDLVGLWAGVGVVLVLVVLNPRVLRWGAARAARGETPPPVELRDVYLWIALYAAGWVMGGILLFSVLAMFQPLSPGQLPAVVGIWALSGVLSMLTMVLPSSLGVMEITLTTLLSAMVPTGLAVLVALSVRGLTTVLDLLWGGLAALLQWVPIPD